MKKLILLLTFLFTISFGFAQINFESEYTHSGTYAKMAISGYKFYVMDVATSQCRIYNMDHSLWKTIDLPVPADNYLYDIKYVSENLFSTDNSLALLYTYYYYDVIYQYYIYSTKIIKEDGTVLLTVPEANFAYAYNLEGEGTKMLVYTYDYAVFPTPVKTIIYNLPGDLLSSASDNHLPEPGMKNPYPNPAGNFAIVPYELPDGQTEGVITLTDLNGNIKQSFRVDNHIDHLKIETGKLQKGTYLFYLSAGNYTSDTKKLIVQ